jgi:serine protease Do
VGIDTHRVGDGFYLAVPADDELRGRVEALGRGEEPRRPRLGIAVAPPQVARRLRRSVGLPERDGILVRAVEEGGPAAVAGIRQGDLVVAVAGTAVGTVDDLAAALAGAGSGVGVDLAVVRGVEELTVTITIAP